MICCRIFLPAPQLSERHIGSLATLSEYLTRKSKTRASDSTHVRTPRAFCHTTALRQPNTTAACGRHASPAESAAAVGARAPVRQGANCQAGRPTTISCRWARKLLLDRRCAIPCAAFFGVGFAGTTRRVFVRSSVRRNQRYRPSDGARLLVGVICAGRPSAPKHIQCSANARRESA